MKIVLLAAGYGGWKWYQSKGAGDVVTTGPVGRSPAGPTAVSVAEVRENIQDALALYLEDMREDDSDNDDAVIAREEVEVA